MEKGGLAEKIHKEIVTEISTNLARDINVQIQEAEQNSNMINVKKIPRCIIKLTKIKQKREKSIQKKKRKLYRKDNLNASGFFIRHHGGQKEVTEYFFQALNKKSVNSEFSAHQKYSSRMKGKSRYSQRKEIKESLFPANIS